ncbi:hypothetical protein ARHIZOSPH14_07170 [Agromyces rhizosphaerae]|uniref:Metallopeptidase family protein n=1 Tax=Agromyces rhizosphaerae TaxID=88374 RepID=A0A9W6FNI8_9MICO|nr:metallopeptidase family protein [Agromyces rhizosphaerae]GLI26475.1 hypothetical protein ARHIZOSPH14_07170 [Agromyces rhizosphaerae]
MVAISDDDFERLIGEVFDELPDRITLYRNNLAEHSDDLDALRARVRITLVHEIGHYFGLDDPRLRELGWA